MSLVKAQVLAAGVSYFSSETVAAPDGEPMKDQNGNTVYTYLRHEAAHGDTVEMTQAEFTRLEGLGAVREPSDAPLRPANRATPFGVPVEGEDGQLRAYAGPVMGDPASTAGATDIEIGRGPSSLTPDQAAELEAQAAGQTPGQDGIDLSESSDEELATYLETAKPNVQATLDLAKGSDGEYDPQFAARVLAAEEARENPRAGVVDVLEDVE